MEQQQLQAYKKAKAYFQEMHPEWICTIEQDCLVIQLNWQNVTYFNGRGLTHSARAYRHIVKLYPDGKFLTLDTTVDDIQTVGLGDVHISRDAFAGKKWNFHYEKELGYDHDTDKFGIQTYKFSTSDIQKPVREYFENEGYTYKFYSVKEDFRALDGKTKLAVGILFTFIGLIFYVAAFAILGNPNLEITSTTNGITTTKLVRDIPIMTKAIIGLFPVIFVGVGLLCITDI